MINVLYCFDENYNKQAAVSIFSLLEKVSEKINIYIIHKDPDTFINIKEKIDSHKNLSNLYIHKFINTKFSFPNVHGTHVSEATYYRFFIEEFLESKVDNILYLDSDIVCLNDPIPEIKLKTQKLKNSSKIIAAVSEPQSLRKSLELNSEKYFNAGVMLIDFKKWQECEMEANLINLAENTKKEILFWDQDILNLYFDGEYVELSSYMNHTLGMIPFEKLSYQSIKEIDKINFIHYVGKFKPWSLKGIVNSKSKFYQDIHRALFDTTYHLQSSRKMNTIFDLYKSIISGVYFRVDYPFRLFIVVFKSLLRPSKKKNII